MVCPGKSIHLCIYYQQCVLFLWLQCKRRCAGDWKSKHHRSYYQLCAYPVCRLYTRVLFIIKCANSLKIELIMIEIKNVSKSFEDKQILKDISAVMETGKTNLIIGTSGSGKTVLQKCMVGLFEVDGGEIIFDGQNLTQMTEEERKELRQQIGMLFQGSALFDSMTVEQNIKFPLDMFTKWNYQKKIERVNDVLERVELGGTNKKYPSEISGGMKKRVGIARAIVLKPKYLFCDEPNSGLDPQTSMVIDKLI